MKRAWKAVKHFFCPHVALLLILTFGSAAGLFVVFTKGLEESWMAYGLYSIAAYTAVCLSWRLIDGIFWAKKVIHRNSIAHRYLTDLEYKGTVSLWVSFSISLLYSFLKGTASIYYRSAWFGSLASYYIVLAAERFLLLYHIQNCKENRLKALRQYRFCGYTLLILTPTLLAIGFQAIRDGETVVYPGYMIFAAAGFTFFSFGMAVYNLIRYRQVNDPIHLASKMLSMASALVSVFFLQTAMLSVFDDGKSLAPVMNLITGIAVFLLIMSLGVFMVRDGNKKIKQASKKAA